MRVQRHASSIFFHKIALRRNAFLSKKRIPNHCAVPINQGVIQIKHIKGLAHFRLSQVVLASKNRE
ncbi:Uncharacterised protein [Vibrio cholerae]|nr:Uncharacterised protein [Vibrio cholerae]